MINTHCKDITVPPVLDSHTSTQLKIAKKKGNQRFNFGCLHPINQVIKLIHKEVVSP